jgi:hypothetical protein
MKKRRLVLNCDFIKNIELPSGFKFNPKDCALRQIRKNEYGLFLNNKLNWVLYSGYSVDPKLLGIPVFEKKEEKLHNTKIILEVFNLYNPKMRIPEGYIQCGFDTPKGLFNKDIKYYLSYEGKIEDTCFNLTSSLIVVGLKKVNEKE